MQSSGGLQEALKVISVTTGEAHYFDRPDYANAIFVGTVIFSPESKDPGGEFFPRLKR
jgi:hypothetical protein